MEALPGSNPVIQRCLLEITLSFVQHICLFLAFFLLNQFVGKQKDEPSLSKFRHMLFDQVWSAELSHIVQVKELS